MNSTVAIPRAALGLRLLALLYDLLPLLGLWFLAGVIGVAVTDGTLDPHRFAHRAMIQILLIVFSASYFVISWSNGGQTIGMRAWKLRLVTEDGFSLPWPRALLRFFLASISLGALGIGFWWALFDPQRRTIHDIALGTAMRSEPRQK
ncbi:MAG: RDD family protein [Rudaea sp.]